MNIRAKMVVEKVTKTEYGAEQVSLHGVYSDGWPENNSFAKATPCASLQMTVDNPGAHGVFVEGRSFYLDFTQAE